MYGSLPPDPAFCPAIEDRRGFIPVRGPFPFLDILNILNKTGNKDLVYSDLSIILLPFQVGAFGDPGRDPRGWTITVAYGAVVPDTNLGVKAADDAKDAQWRVA